MSSDGSLPIAAQHVATALSPSYRLPSTRAIDVNPAARRPPPTTVPGSRVSPTPASVRSKSLHQGLGRRPDLVPACRGVGPARSAQLAPPATAGRMDRRPSPASPGPLRPWQPRRGDGGTALGSLIRPKYLDDADGDSQDNSGEQAHDATGAAPAPTAAARTPDTLTRFPPAGFAGHPDKYLCPAREFGSEIRSSSSSSYNNIGTLTPCHLHFAWCEATTSQSARFSLPFLQRHRLV